MALILDLTYSQSNNAVTLTLTDNAGTYHVDDNPGGWEIGGATNPDVADIVASSDVVNAGSETHLLLDVTVTDKNGTTTVYDQINLYDHDSTGPFTTTADLTWDFNPSHFSSGGTAMGLSTDKLTDGVYSITYSLVDNDNHSSAAATPLAESVTVDGDVRYDVYNKLRQVPVDYDCEDNDKSRDIMEALLSYSYLISIEAAASESRTEEIYTQLYTLDKLLSDGSSYTW